MTKKKPGGIPGDKNTIQEEIMNCCNYIIKTAGRMFRGGFLATAILFAAVPAHAAFVQFTLDLSNALPDGPDYLSVSMTENDTGGVDFLVKTLDALNDIANKKFGIQKFGFSFLDDAWGAVSGLPGGWHVKSNKRLDGYGKFGIRLQGKGKGRTDELSFSVNDVSLDDFDTIFAAHVAGFKWCKIHEWGNGEICRGGNHCTTSAYFAGEMGDVPPDNGPSPVPIPPAALLFGSGLLGLIGIARRRARRYSSRTWVKSFTAENSN